MLWGNDRGIPGTSYERRFPGLDDATIWDLSDALYVLNPNFIHIPWDKDGNACCIRDIVNQRAVSSTEDRYCNGFLKGGSFRDLRGKLQGRVGDESKPRCGIL